MNAVDELQRLLGQHQAVLVRQKRHLVYKLPNGQNFVLAKTPGDPERSAKNGLADLRRALGIVRAEPAQKGETTTQMEQITTPELSAPARKAEMQTLKHRIEAAIALSEQEQETLLAAAQKTERRIQMLNAVLAFAEDAAIEDVLRALMPQLKPPLAMDLTPPEPPQRITERVQVTRQLVFAATQTFEDTFTVNDVLALMTGGARIDGPERLRVRSSIAQSVMTLYERGELIRVAEGWGKRQAIWRKAALNGGR